MADPQKYRDEAVRLRREAGIVVAPDIREQLPDIAGQSERLAALVESMSRDHLPIKLAAAADGRSFRRF